MPPYRPILDSIHPSSLSSQIVTSKSALSHFSCSRRFAVEIVEPLVGSLEIRSCSSSVRSSITMVARGSLHSRIPRPRPGPTSIHSSPRACSIIACRLVASDSNCSCRSDHVGAVRWNASKKNAMFPTQRRLVGSLCFSNRSQRWIRLEQWFL